MTILSIGFTAEWFSSSVLNAAGEKAIPAVLTHQGWEFVTLGAAAPAQFGPTAVQIICQLKGCLAPRESLHGL